MEVGPSENTSPPAAPRFSHGLASAAGARRQSPRGVSGSFAGRALSRGFENKAAEVMQSSQIFCGDDRGRDSDVNERLEKPIDDVVATTGGFADHRVEGDRGPDEARNCRSRRADDEPKEPAHAIRQFSAPPHAGPMSALLGFKFLFAPTPSALKPIDRPCAVPAGDRPAINRVIARRAVVAGVGLGCASRRLCRESSSAGQR